MDMELVHSLVQKVAPRIPSWIKRPLGGALRRAGLGPHLAPLFNGRGRPGQPGQPGHPDQGFGELPADFIGETRVRIGHKERINARDFPVTAPCFWLDRPDAEAEIERRLAAGELTPEQAERCRAFARDGFITIEGLLSEAAVDAAIEAYVRGRRDGSLQSENGDRRYLNPHLKVPEVRALMRDPALLGWIELLLGHRCIPYQSIGAEWGSEQLEHSDAIHMSTYPLGGLVAAWIACEDVHPDSGPLVYYPGSHKLPYHFSQDVGIGPDEFHRRSYACYAEKYEPFIQRLIQKSDGALTPRYLHAKKGDVLLWHHNLIHGGSRIRDAERTRKSIVCHYFARGVFCYADLPSSRIPTDRLE